MVSAARTPGPIGTAQKVRAWIYRIATAALLVASIFEISGELWTELAATLPGVVTSAIAALNTPTTDPDAS